MRSPAIAAGIDADPSTAERYDVKQAAGHRNILEEVDELVLVAKRAMENHSSSK